MHRTLIACILVSAAFLAALPAQAAFWDVEPVYTGGFATGDASLAVSGTNLPHISYSAAGGLYLALRQVGGWVSEFVAPVGFSGGWSSAAFDAVGQPCVAFIDCTPEETCYLRFAVKTAGTWQVETVEDVGWLPDHVSLCRDASGRMCVAYCRTSGDQVMVRFARRLGTNNWSKETVASVGSVTGPSIAVDGTGTPHIAFVDSATRRLMVAARRGSPGWTVEEVDGGPAAPAVWYCWLTTGPDGRPAAAYFVSSGGQVRLRFAVRSEAGWQTETAAVLSGAVAYSCSAVVTPGGLPIIAFRDPASGSLKHAWKSGGVWRVQTIDAAPGAGARTCLRLDAVGNVHAAYVDSSAGDVRFAWAPVPISVSDARGVQDGLTIHLAGVIASTAASDLASVVYVQEADRSSGLRLRFTGPVPSVARGMVLDVQGTIATSDGEREIVDPVLAETDR